jgi:16S rRNA (guanine966-N2)-methyltransferase
LTSSLKNKVRIGGGEWRSRLLAFPDVPGLRPTPDRVRQTVFNWLGQQMQGLTCLDLFSGTGIMGFEALSRGASSAVLVEKSHAVYQSLSQNKQLLKAENVQILNMDALQFLAGNKQLFDVIFLDPPYNQGWMEKLQQQIGEHLTPEGLVYAEAEFGIESDTNWQVLKQGKAGNVYYHLIKSL